MCANSSSSSFTANATCNLVYIRDTEGDDEMEINPIPSADSDDIKCIFLCNNGFPLSSPNLSWKLK